jgi:hypothetical protein
MTFWKLVRAIACGILLAEFVNGVVYGAITGYQEARARHLRAQAASRFSSDPYQTALDRVRGGTATQQQSIVDYCRSTLLLSDNQERAIQQMTGCISDTTARMARDLE